MGTISTLTNKGMTDKKTDQLLHAKDSSITSIIHLG